MSMELEGDTFPPPVPLTFQLTCCAAESWVTLVLFCRVRNAPTLRSDATEGRIQAALLDPTFLVSPFHVLAAVNRAVVNKEQQLMKTRNVYSEIIFSLSPSTNISDSFKKFGIKDTSQSVLAVLLHDEKECSEVEDLVNRVDGEVAPLDMLTSIHDEDGIQKLYKVFPEERSISSLENSVVTRMVIKDVT